MTSTERAVRKRCQMTPSEQARADAMWEAVPGFPAYAVSSLGAIRRTTPWDTRGRRVVKRVALTPRIDAEGYAHVCLHNGSRQKTFRVHTLVLTAFLGPAEGREANHKNGQRADNRLDNLEWATHAENIRATYRAGRGAQQKPGYKNPMRGEARASRLFMPKHSVNENGAYVRDFEEIKR